MTTPGIPELLAQLGAIFDEASGSWTVKCPDPDHKDGDVLVSYADDRHAHLYLACTCEVPSLILGRWLTIPDELLDGSEIFARVPGEDDGDEPEKKPAEPELPALPTRRITLEQIQAPPVEQFIVGNLFPFGKASVIYGPQGAGKSALLGQLAFRVAAGGGGTFLAMHMHDQDGSPVLVYSAEDTFEDWQRKAAAVRAAWPDLDMPRALERLHIADKSEGLARLSELVQLRTTIGLESVLRSEPRPTPEHLAIIASAKALQARLVIIETASRLVDDEGNKDFAALLAACGHIAAQTNAAVVLSHHPNKNAAGANDSSLEGVRGGGAFTANSRTAVSLFPANNADLQKLSDEGMAFPDEDVVVLRHEKSTSSVPRQPPIILVRCGTPHGLVLRLPADVSTDPALAAQVAHRVRKQRASRDEVYAALYDLVAELMLSGPVSKRRIRDHAETPRRLGLPKRAIESTVDAAVVAGVLKVKAEDSSGRVLALELGRDPQTVRPRATSPTEASA